MAVKRERLIHPFFVMLFGGAVSLAAALLLTQAGLVERVKSAPPNALSVAYLEAWIRVRKDDLPLYALLASQYIRSGRLAEAQPLVSDLMASGDIKLQQNVLELEMNLREQQLWALAVNDPQRTVLKGKLSALVQRSSRYTWPAPILKTLAMRAHALDMPTLSTHYFKRLAQVDPHNVQKWQALANNWTLADGRYLEAAQAAFAMGKAAPTVALQRQYFLSGMAIMESGNLLPQAMREIDSHLTPDLIQDAATLRVLIRMARSANRTDLASDYARRLLNLPEEKPREQNAALPPIAFHGNTRGSGYRRDWVYLDGVRGNALRAQMDAAGGHRAGIVRVADVQNTTSLVTSSEGQQQDDLSLAYDVFLADQKLDQALEVVNRALKHNPENVVWLKRSAVVNEWLGHPDAALPAWLALARRTDSKEAWKAVERLAIALYDDVAYIEALRHRTHGVDELMLVDQIVATYERLAEPQQALAFLEKQIKISKHQKELLERYAALAERAGEDDLALKTWLTLNQRFGPNSDYALKIASKYSVEGNFEQAMNALLTAKDTVSASDSRYWRILMDTATRTGRDDVARMAARNLINDKALKNDELTSMISLWSAYPIDAGRIAEDAFHRTGQIGALQQAVYHYSRAKAWPRIDALLAQLTPEQLKEAESSVDFLLAKAEYLRQVGRNQESLTALRQVIALDDSSREARAAYLWALIDGGSNAELLTALQRWQQDAENDGQMWGAYGAGYMRLSREAESLHFFHKDLPAKHKDPLWQLTYAEALDTFGFPDRAWRIRRHAWRQISQHRAMLLGNKNSKAAPTASLKTRQNAERDAEASLDGADGSAELRSMAANLAQSYAGGDYSRALLLQLLRNQRLQPSDRIAAKATLPQSEMPDLKVADTVTSVENVRAPTAIIAEDVALAWSLSNEPYELARLWMAQRYGKELERPTYAEVAVALAMDDRVELDRLLKQNPDRIPVLSRIEANMRLDRWSEAQRLAFEGASGNPHNEELQNAVREIGLLNAHYVEAGYRSFRQDPLDFDESDVGLGLRLSDRWTLTASATDRAQRSTQPTVLVNVPGHDRTVLAGINWRDSDTSILFEGGRRQAVRNITPMRLEVLWHQQRSLSWGAELGYNQASTDTAELRVGGVMDRASITSEWQIGAREFANARIDANRYYDQDRRALGTGRQFNLEAGYKFRLGYPDFTLRGVYTHATYDAIGTDAGPIFGHLSPDGVASSAEIMPSNFTQAGLLFNFGMDLKQNYTRAWRPFMEAGYLHDSKYGWGLSGTVGFAGTVFGNDHAMIYYTHERDAQSINSGAPMKEIGVRYRWYF